MAVYLKDSAQHLEVPIITSGTGFKTDWKPRILFANTVDISSGLYFGLDGSFADTTVTKWNTLSTKDSNIINASTNSLLFEGAYTYCDQILECNNTLYNKYYKEDIEWNLSNSAYLLTGKFLLNANDIQELSFKNTIYVNNPAIGGSFYRINSIKNYKPEQMTEVELIKVNSRVPGYDSSILATQIYYTYSGPTQTTGGSSSGGGSGGGGTAASNLSELGDVLITSPTEGNFLEYDADVAKWKNSTKFDTSVGFLVTNVMDISTRVYSCETNKLSITDASTTYTRRFANILLATGTTYLVSASDNNNIIQADASMVITFPNTLDVGFQTTVVNSSTGYITMNASTLLTTDSSVRLRDQYAGASFVHKGSGVWFGFGNLK